MTLEGRQMGDREKRMLDANEAPGVAGLSAEQVEKGLRRMLALPDEHHAPGLGTIGILGIGWSR